MTFVKTAAIANRQNLALLPGFWYHAIATVFTNVIQLRVCPPAPGKGEDSLAWKCPMEGSSLRAKFAPTHNKALGLTVTTRFNVGGISAHRCLAPHYYAQLW